MSIIKKIWLPGIILIIGFSAIFLIMATKPTPTANPDLLAEPAKPKVKVLAAAREKVTISTTSQGTVHAKREIAVIAQVSGIIMNVSQSFVSGDFFKNSEILIEIDDRDYKTALLSAKARLSQAKRSLAEEKGRSRQAQREWRDLKNQDANDLFLRKPQLAEAQADVDYAQAAVELAQLNIERTKIRLPFNGRIKQTLVNVGQFVSTGTRLAEVYDTASAEVRLPLSDRQIALLDLPISGNELANKPKVTLIGVIGGKEYSWQAQIKRTEASVDVNSRMYFAIAEVDMPYEINKAAPLLPGLFVRAEIEGKELNNVLVLPKDVIVKRDHIYILNDDNEIEITPVTVLNKNGDQVWLQANIDENTSILIEKHAVLSIGEKIEPIYKSSELQPSGEIAVAKVKGQ
ncbi:MAG: efflux RND transporter periplasmic adaptor subunit [Thalassotalea sp.]